MGWVYKHTLFLKLLCQGFHCTAKKNKKKNIIKLSKLGRMGDEEREGILCHIFQLDQLQQTQSHLLQGVSLHSFSASLDAMFFFYQDFFFLVFPMIRFLLLFLFCCDTHEQRPKERNRQKGTIFIFLKK
jgi:hypothetical protein